jgi:hypothetical protein
MLINDISIIIEILDFGKNCFDIILKISLAT